MRQGATESSSPSASIAEQESLATQAPSTILKGEFLVAVHSFSHQIVSHGFSIPKMSTSMSTINALPNAVSIPDEAHEEARGRATYHSFGEDGVTATASAHGHLLQMTQHLQNVPSGFVSVDLAMTSEPYLVAQRVRELHSYSIDPTKGIRLLFEEANDETPGLDIWETDPPTLRTMPASSPWRASPEESIRRVQNIALGSETEQTSRPPPRIDYMHNRWPRFSTTTPALDVTIQYVISGKTVYQIYSFRQRPGAPSPSGVPRIIINADVFRRNLEFSTRNATDARMLDSKYNSYVQAGGHCVARVQDFATWDEHESEARDSKGVNHGRASIALFISPFINGIRQQPSHGDANINQSRYAGNIFRSSRTRHASRTQENVGYYVTPDQRLMNSNSEGEVLEITLAYTLQPVPHNQAEFTSPVSEADLEEAKNKIDKELMSPMSISTNKHLDFILRRNLEHILSVCAIPVASDPSTTPAVALTCGDISGHRVTGKASFHAFQFLLSAFQYFDLKSRESCSCRLNCTCQAYSAQMRKRILDTCWGHMNWLFGQVDENESDSPHTWVNGKAIANWKSHKSLPNRTVIDGCFRIINALEFCQKAATREMAMQLTQRIGSVVSNWIRQLHQFKQEDDFIFPHCLEDTPQKFYLADHAMIWFTLRSLEGFKPSLHSQMSSEDFNLPELLNYGSGRHKTIYSSSKIRKSILANFATQSRHLDDTLLTATCRSICETSFLLQEQDTMTLHCMAEGLFDEPSSGSTPDGTSIEESTSIHEPSSNLDDRFLSTWGTKVASWQRTLGIQEHHPANDDETSTLDMHNYASSVLLKSSSPNGLFPGQLDENKQPLTFQDEWMRDSHWHTTV
ncbi:hypothetical protein TgHK011_001851 [Trichoderma gracile]|nr:hypothetical protein TgHK011_001851 [Trichoderma gracile]